MAKLAVGRALVALTSESSDVTVANSSVSGQASGCQIDVNDRSTDNSNCAMLLLTDIEVSQGVSDRGQLSVVSAMSTKLRADDSNRVDNSLLCDENQSKQEEIVTGCTDRGES